MSFRRRLKVWSIECYRQSIWAYTHRNRARLLSRSDTGWRCLWRKRRRSYGKLQERDLHGKGIVQWLCRVLVPTWRFGIRWSRRRWGKREKTEGFSDWWSKCCFLNTLFFRNTYGKYMYDFERILWSLRGMRRGKRLWNRCKKTFFCLGVLVVLFSSSFVTAWCSNI